MADPLRPITVDGVRLRWRFDGRLVVVPADRSGPQLYVDWGWVEWFEPGGLDVDPMIVTPRFVASAVRFALSHGWEPSRNGAPVRLSFADGEFNVAS